jgi:hypothetical protein
MTRPASYVSRLIAFAGDDRKPPRPPSLRRGQCRPFYLVLREKIARGQRKGLTLREIAEQAKVPVHIVQFEVTTWLNEGRP